MAGGPVERAQALAGNTRGLTCSNSRSGDGGIATNGTASTLPWQLEKLTWQAWAGKAGRQAGIRIMMKRKMNRYAR